MINKPYTICINSMQIVYNSNVHTIGYDEKNNGLKNPIKISIIGDMSILDRVVNDTGIFKYGYNKEYISFGELNNIINNQLPIKDFNIEKILNIKKESSEIDIVIGYNPYDNIIYTPFYSTTIPMFDKWDDLCKDISDIHDIYTRFTRLGYRLLSNELLYKIDDGKMFYIKNHIIKRIDITINSRKISNMTFWTLSVDNVIIQPVYKGISDQIVSYRGIIHQGPLVQLPMDILRYILLCDVNLVPTFINTNKRFFSLLLDPSFLRELVNIFKKRQDFPHWFCNPIIIRDWMKIDFRKEINRLIDACKELDSTIKDNLYYLIPEKYTRNYRSAPSPDSSLKYMITGGFAVKHFYGKTWSSDIDIWYPKIRHELERKMIRDMDFVPDKRSFFSVLAAFDISLCQIGYINNKDVMLSPAFLHSFFNKETLLFLYVDDKRYSLIKKLDLKFDDISKWEINFNGENKDFDRTHDISKTIERYRKYQNRGLVNSYAIAPRKFVSFDMGEYFWARD